jgi:hypothetical protein
VCTLSWLDTSDGYQLFFNRDERRERGPEVPAALRRRGRTRFVAPLDGDFGGTWIAVNEHGLSVCLLNGFPAHGAATGDPRREYTSRGSLPLSLIELDCCTDISRNLLDRDLAPFRPFVLVAFAPGGAGLTARWSGAGLDIEDQRPAEQPLVSSSFYTEQVRASRVAVFRELVSWAAHADPAAGHLAFHASHLPERGPHSPCMHRPDASTVSFSRIEVRDREVAFHYTPRSPCRGLPAEPSAVLGRAVSRGSGPEG